MGERRFVARLLALLWSSSARARPLIEAQLG